MPYLGDFLGALAREVTLARLQADVEAVRIAEQYANDPLLRRWSVPRFRMPTVSMRVPVAVQGLEEAAARSINPDRVREVFGSTLNEHMEALGMDLPAATLNRVDAAIETTIGGLTSPGAVALSERKIAEDLADAAITAMKARRPASSAAAQDIEAQRGALTGKLASALAGVLSEPPRLNVLVTTEQIKEAAGNVVQVELKLSEEGVEWTMLDPDDPGSSRLVPE